jgi:hypothetical protein
MLARELRALNARDVVLQIAMDERDLRLDGLPRANAHASHPGVVLAFESRHGPLKFAVDTFRSWEDNLRAIALGMEALRKVDRYGVTKRGEQYTGWKALPAGDPVHDNTEGLATAEEALVFVFSLVDDLYDYDDVEGAFRQEAVRLAIRRTHPDQGGDVDKFRKVIRAKALVL